MEIAWRKIWPSSRNRLKAGWLITSGLIAIYLGVAEPVNRFREEQTQRKTGLGAVALEPTSMWHQMSPLHETLRKAREGVVGGVPGIGAGHRSMYLESAAVDTLPAPPPRPPGTTEDRKTVRTGAMDLVVKIPRDTSEKIRELAERLEHFWSNSEINGGQDASSASPQIRAPASRFEVARAEIRKLRLRVESEKLRSEDVTKQYVDQTARLRNLREQETQYQGILKQDKTVQDTVDLSEKLDEVRGEI